MLYRTLFKKCVAVGESLENAEGYLARANFKMAQIHAALGNSNEEKSCMEAARKLRSEACTENSSIDDSEHGYNSLVPWMLW